MLLYGATISAPAACDSTPSDSTSSDSWIILNSMQVTYDVVNQQIQMIGSNECSEDFYELWSKDSWIPHFKQLNFNTVITTCNLLMQN